MTKYIRFILTLLIQLCYALSSHGQNATITTVAGNHTAGSSGDGGPATAASMDHPNGVAFDGSGNMYVSDYFSHRIRKVSATGVITTIAGTGTIGFSGDGGAATAANINRPVGLVLDGSGNILFSDSHNHRIRKINSAGVISTIAGIGAAGSSGDGGPATAARLNYPFTMVLDGSGNLYIGDYSNSKIRKINTAGIISTFAGTGSAGYSGDGGPATSAQMHLPYGLAITGSGDVYFADYGRHVIRKVNSSGIITTIAGNGIAAFSGDGGPATAAQFNVPNSVAFDAYGNCYIADMTNQRIRKINTAGVINTIAGNGTAGYSGDGGLATLAAIESPTSLVFNSAGDLYFGDYENNVVRKLSFTPTYVADSFSIFVGGSCSGTQITLIPDHYSSGMYVKTFFGEGYYDSSVIPSTGSLTISHSYPNSGTYTVKHKLYNGFSAIDSFKYTYKHTVCNSFAVCLYYDANSNCVKGCCRSV